MVDATRNRLRSLTRRVQAVFRSPERADGQWRDLDRRLQRIERQLETLEKIWQRTRHLEPAIQAVLRQLYLDPSGLPYPERLTARRFRIASQNQEDGLTLALLQEAGVTQARFVEIGSGLSGGNSAFLARECGWTGLMVDGASPTRMEQVGRRFPTARAIHAWVTRDNINDLIAAHGFGGEVDLFSLDLDGNDYWIWEAMTACSPRVVILEYNSMFGPDRAVTIPYDADFNRHRHHTMYYGASLAALTHVAAVKGYRLVAVEPAGINAYFLRNDLAPNVPPCSPASAFRTLEKHDVLIASGQDVFTYAATHELPLVEVA